MFARQRSRLNSLHHLGWFIVAVLIIPAHAQFASRVLGGAAGEFVVETAAAPTQSSPSPNQQDPGFTIQQGVQLPECPNHRVLSTTGVPARWGNMTLERQVAHPINAVMLQLAFVAWQDDPKATLSKCMENLGIDLDSVSTVHRVVFPYLGTMSAVVIRAGDKGVFVAFRGTDFSDRGDVLVDADCQHTGDKGSWLGSKRSIHLHTGFYRAWESVAPAVIPLVWAQLQQTQTKRVYIVGHSLGASMGAIAALRLNYLFSATDASIGGVWLYGCPRVGNKAWMQEYNRQLGKKTLRMANYGDFATRLPMERQVCTSSTTLVGAYEFRHVGRAVVMCPDNATGLAEWRLFANGTEEHDCGTTPEIDLTVSTHWLGPYLDAWRRAHVAKFDSDLSTEPCITSVLCEQCSLSFPEDRAKQLNVPARAGGPIACCTSASCSLQSAWDAAATIGPQLMRSFNPDSVCKGFVCT